MGTAAAQVIVVATAPLLTRMYHPTDVGTFSVAVAILTVVLTVCCLSYDLAVPLPSNEREAANLLLLCLVISLGVSDAHSEKAPVRSACTGG
jgi:O-antigen/teichoic acid export membrane protein